MAKKCGFIALAGRPNAGKSTLLNKVLGEKVSIVSDKPQTTRNRILGVYHGDDLQIGFLDLPGIHKPKHRLNRMMMRAVHQGLDDADVIFHVVDLTAKIGSGDRFVHEFISTSNKPVILVLNKIDAVNKSKMIEKLAALYEQFKPVEIVPISALAGDNLDRLIAAATPFLPEQDFRFEEDELTDQSVRFMAGEMIREKILHHTRQELPHSVAVTIEEFVEEPESTTISAILWVERPTQRQILLGSEGQMISKIRQAARRELVKLLGTPVDLSFYVKIEPQWRDTEHLLQRQDLRLTL